MNNRFKIKPVSFVTFDGEGDDGEDKAFTKEQFEAELQRRLEQETSGLKAKQKELLDQINKSKPLLSQLEKVGGAEGLESILEFKSKVEQDEILKLFSEGKTTEALEKHTEKLRVTHSAQLQEIEGKLNEAATEKEKLEARLSKVLVDGEVTRLFIQEKGFESAIDDVALRARQVWRIEGDDIVARDGAGNLIQGEKGPLTMQEWVQGLKKTAPHLFPETRGSLKGGDNSGGGGSGVDEMLEAAKKGPAALREWKEKNKKR